MFDYEIIICFEFGCDLLAASDLETLKGEYFETIF